MTSSNPDPNSYPDSPDQATADRIARFLVRDGNTHHRNFQRAISANTPEYHARDAAYSNAYFLRLLRHIDPAAADIAAQAVCEAWEDRGTVIETLADWAAEYGQNLNGQPAVVNSETIR